jgi:hypothetical protein
MYLRRKLEKQVLDNNRARKELRTRVTKDTGYQYTFLEHWGEQELDHIYFNTILCNFRSGFRDKNTNLLQSYYQRPDEGYLEIDCKVCFSNYTSDLNPVVYCSKCDTAFHKCCYGINELPEGDFFCDLCLHN